MSVGLASTWSVQIREVSPRLAIPGPTQPCQVVAIWGWMSPWFHAKPLPWAGHPGPWLVTGAGAAPCAAPRLEQTLGKKKSSLPNRVNVGVRLGSALTMWRICSSAWSAMLTVIGVVWPVIGSGSDVAEISRSSPRTVGASWPGGGPEGLVWLGTMIAGASSLSKPNVVASPVEPLMSAGRLVSTSPTLRVKPEVPNAAPPCSAVSYWQATVTPLQPGFSGVPPA